MGSEPSRVPETIIHERECRSPPPEWRQPPNPTVGPPTPARCNGRQPSSTIVEHVVIEAPSRLSSPEASEQSSEWMPWRFRLTDLRERETASSEVASPVTNESKPNL